MTAKLLIAAAALAVAVGTLPATAASVTSDPESAITEGQKLGPNERTTQHGNSFVTRRNGDAYGRGIAPSADVYGYYQGPGYAYERPGHVYGRAPGLSVYGSFPGYVHDEPLNDW